jgi:hypothetical protein
MTAAKFKPGEWSSALLITQCRFSGTQQIGVWTDPNEGVGGGKEKNIALV